MQVQNNILRQQVEDLTYRPFKTTSQQTYENAFLAAAELHERREKDIDEYYKQYTFKPTINKNTEQLAQKAKLRPPKAPQTKPEERPSLDLRN